jgi:adenylate kinase
LGNKVKGIIEAGNLVPDEVVIEIIEEFLKNKAPTQWVIFDGVPRKVTQKDLFEKVATAASRHPLGILIAISDELALKRLSGRHMSKKTGKIYPSKDLALEECPAEDVYQRSDDTPEAIRTRLKNYHEETEPVIAWYREQGRLVEVDGQGGAERVTEKIMTKIRERDSSTRSTSSGQASLGMTTMVNDQMTHDQK